MTTTFAWLAVLVPLPILFLLWLSEGQTQRIRRQRRQGWTLKAIAAHHGISVTTVRRRHAQ
jgi:AraC-like DNA-binding protein